MLQLATDREARAQLISLARPRGMLFVLLLPLVGYGYAHWEHRLAASAVMEIAAVVTAWLFLHAGTMWLNAALDRDEGAVLYGDVTPVPPCAQNAGLCALALCVAVATLAGLGASLCAAACAMLSIAYSHPRTALKGHPFLGPTINVLGYGILSPAAGWWVVDSPPTARTAVMCLLFCAFILALYFTAQCFQRAEDAARGYRTLVVTHGPIATVRAARSAWWLGAGGVALLAAIGWLPHICVIAVLVVPRLMRWTQTGKIQAPTQSLARRTTYGAMAYGLTLLALAWGDHLYGSSRIGQGSFALGENPGDASR